MGPGGPGTCSVTGVCAISALDDGANDTGRRVASGIYLVRLQAAGRPLVTKATLLK